MTTDTPSDAAPATVSTAGLDFIRQIVVEDRQAGHYGGRVHTRFPPEPNGYLHIGHAKSICLNFGLAAEHGGLCNLRMDDTNPTTESEEYVRAIEDDVRWLGFDWGDRFFHAADYFEQLYACALQLIAGGKAYVCDLQGTAVSEYRGLWNEPGRNSPYRDRSVAENLDLFARMRAGEFEDGSRTLRAKIDMASPNMNMRDPAIYRIRRMPHYRTGDAWCIYPMYDFTHPLSDALEGITHSLCTLEFEDHRPLYDWFLENIDLPGRPRQIEFARLNLSYTVLRQAQAARACRRKACGRLGRPPDADHRRVPAPRLHARGGARLLRTHRHRQGQQHRVDRPVAGCRASGPQPARVAGHGRAASPEGGHRELSRGAGRTARGRSTTRKTRAWGRGRCRSAASCTSSGPTSGTNPPKKYFRLAPGREVRLRYAYFLTCREAVRDPETGDVVELRCTYDPATRGGYAPDGRKGARHDSLGLGAARRRGGGASL